ncbi:hypothetical protein QYE76_057860 [Lolium multiflorum]|uniref:Reverse transcriptase domain-containing protein n=1 Tax=Lolium multiflorum TaxID=4521 RepID=A0AAD8WPG1_LOLMU|nr:hypothetical protein QYE76_057860 [Lolium multiflorum]
MDEDEEDEVEDEDEEDEVEDEVAAGGEVEMETESTHESDSRAELEVMEGGGAPKPLKIRGEARVPEARKEPKTHDDKALIIPSSDDNWTWEVKPARVPNSLLGALIKKFWPGRYTPLSTVPGGETKLATTWADYEDAPAVGFATAAEAVTTKFWVCPEWAEQHREAWEELIRARWLREDEEFAAVSRRNMENRGTGGTHCAGNRDYTRFKGKKVAEAAPGVVLHDAQIYDMMRTKQKPNPALPQPQYYGNAKAAKEDYCDMVLSRHPEVDDPLSMPTDEESLVLSGRGRRHGRYPFLNKAVKPTPATSYTRLKHTLTADSPQPRPRPARPPAYDPEFEAAFEACNEAYQQAAAQWNRQNTAYMAYIGEMMISMSTGTPPPARVTVAGDMPIMPSRAAFAATYYGSTPQHLENSESEAFRKERDELEEIFLRQPILKHDLPVEDLGTTPPPKEDPVFDLKPLPDNLKYAHIDDKKIYPVIISSKLSEIEEERLLEILKKHRGAIGYTLDDLKGISPSICQHAINMEDDAKPVVEHQRRLIPKMKEVVRNEVLKLLEAGIIYPIADSRWVSPVHCVPKKGGMTVVPNDNDELIPQRIVVGRMPFGLCNAPATFQRCMSAIFHGFCESIVERCEETNLVLNWEKCHFMVNEGIVLGHKISERGIEVDRAKVEAIEKMPYPRDVKDRKGADNPVADNLSRLENIAYDPPVNDSFPNEQLAVIKGALPPALDLDSFPCVEEAIRVADEFCDQYRALKREVEILQEENQRLRRMLEYYSNPSTRPSPPHSGNNESLQVLVQNYKIEKLKLKEILMKREKNPSPSSPKE